MLDTLIYKEEQRKRNSFYASDCLKPSWELFNAWTGVAKTNPPKWSDTLKWGAGNGVEASMLKVLKDSGVVNEDYDQHTHGVVNHSKYGFEIHGRIDAMTKDGLPIEIKSINNKNQFDIGAYQDGYPRENYVGQLSVYMDALGVDTGYLFVASVDGLSTFWFKCTRTGDLFTCGNTVFNLKKEIDRWTKLYNDNILTGVEPDVFEKQYKYPVDTLDWTKISTNKITNARMNRAVVGDFEVAWSSWKDLWVKKQNQVLGYTAEELVTILEKTKGYTSKNKNKDDN